jgi:hypothetical protein
MDAPASIAEFLDRARTAHADFSAAIAALPEAVLSKPGTIGDWSVRDVMAHVGADELWMAGQIEALRFGTLPTVASCYGVDKPVPEGINLATQDGRNAWQRERLSALSLDDVRSMASEAHARLLAVISSLEDAQLSDDLAIGELGTVGHIRKPRAGEQAWPLWQWLRGVTYHHYADHATPIRGLAHGANGNTRAGDTLSPQR